MALEVDGERSEVTVKVASDADGEVYDVSAEYDDVLAVARETDVPIRDHPSGGATVLDEQGH